MEQPKLWTRHFVVGTLVNFLLLLNYYLLMVIMTDFAADRFHASGSSAGLAVSMFIIGTMIARCFSAQLMEKVGKWNLLAAGILLEVAASAAYFLASGLSLLFLIRLAHGISYGLASTAVSTIVTGLVPLERHGEGIGYFMLSSTLGTAVGPFIGMILLQGGGYFNIFLACVITAAVCFLAVFQLRLSPEKRAALAAAQKLLPREKGLRGIMEVKILPICLVCAGIYFCYSSLISFLSPYAGEIGLEGPATLFFLVYSAAILFSRPFTGRLFDRKGADAVMVPAFLSFLAGMALLSQVRHAVPLLLAAALLGFGMGAVQSCGLTLAVKSAPPERISYANSTFYICADAGVGIGPFLLGFLLPGAGYRGMYLVVAGIAAAFTVLYLAVSRGRRKAG